jgi:transcription elongation factor Elf1
MEHLTINKGEEKMTVAEKRRSDLESLAKAVVKAKKRSPIFDDTFACMECGKKYKSVSAARRASMNGCSKCGGVDIDLA